MNIIEVSDYAGIINLSSQSVTSGQPVLVTNAKISGLGHVVEETGHGITSSRGIRVKINDDFYWERDTKEIYIEYFEADPSKSADFNTTAIQEAINYASNHEIGYVYAGVGIFEVNELYFFYDAVKNPEFFYNNVGSSWLQKNDGRIGLIGSGALSIAGLKKNEAHGNHIDRGTIFDFKNVGNDSGHGFNVYDDDQSIATSKVTLQNFSIKYGSNGFAINMKSCPEAVIDTVSIKVISVAGSAIRFTSSWFGSVNKVYAASVLASGEPSQSSVGLMVGSSRGGGIFKVENSLFESFYHNVSDFAEANFFHPMTFQNTAFQASKSHAVSITSGIELTFSQCFWEHNKGSYVKMAHPTATLQIDGGYMLAGPSTWNPSPPDAPKPYTTLPLVDMEDLMTFSIDGVLVRWPRQPFLKVSQTTSRKVVGSVDQVSFIMGGYDVSGEMNIPSLFDIPGQPVFDLIEDGDSSVNSIVFHSKYDVALENSALVNDITIRGRLGNDQLKEVVQTDTLWWNSAGVDNANLISLSASSPNSFMMNNPANYEIGTVVIIHNSSSSTGHINVRDHSGNWTNDANLIQNLQPGDTVKLVVTSTEWAKQTISLSIIK